MSPQYIEKLGLLQNAVSSLFSDANNSNNWVNTNNLVTLKELISLLFLKYVSLSL